MKYLNLLLLLLSLNAYSQVSKIRGKVVEYVSQVPIPYAHVFIQDIMYGTVTNEVGEFELMIDERLMNHQLTISCIGYTDQLIYIPAIDENKGMITLSKSSTLLNDIVISAKIDSAQLILRKAVRSIKKNYPKHKYLQKGFYRELGIKDSSYTRLIEAAIELQDNGYDVYDIDKEDWGVNNTRVKINEVRKSDDYRTYTFLGKILNMISFGDKNNLYKVLQDDLIRYIGKNYDFHFLGKQAIKSAYEIHIEEIHEIGSDKIYQLHLTNKHVNSFTYFVIRIYINSSDYAIIKIQQDAYFELSDPKMEYITKRPYFNSECIYSKYKGKYYLKYINTKRYATGGATSIIDENDKKSIQFDHLMLMINEVYNKKDDFDRIKKKQQSKKSIDLYKSKEKYNEEFWKNYNIILLNPLLNQVQKDLENKESLKKQFLKNGE